MAGSSGNTPYNELLKISGSRISDIKAEHYRINYVSTNLPSYFTDHGHESEQFIVACYSLTVKYRRNISYTTGIATLDKEY